jgi:hypothetical protein
MSTTVHHDRDGKADQDQALNVVAAKAWGLLVASDLSRRDTWDQVLAWVRVGQRLADDPSPEIARRLSSLVAPGPPPRG